MSRADSIPSPSSPSSTALAPTLTNNLLASAGSTSTNCCQHESTLRQLQSDVDTMRQLVTCKICDRLLYEPYALSCGHTYCYSCLTQWLVQHRKVTCPDCRKVIREQPTPSYIVRELVLVFASRNELLPDGETVEEHAKFVKEEAAEVAKDRADTDSHSGGLFKGRFAKAAARATTIRDEEDHVERCPRCLWEVEDGFCTACGEYMSASHEDVSEDDYESDTEDDTEDELDHAMDMEDAHAFFFGADGEPFRYGDGSAYLHGHRYPNPVSGASRRGHRHPATGRVVPTINVASSSESESEDEHDSELEAFIDDDDDNVSTEENMIAGGPANHGVSHAPESGRRRRPVVVSDDEDDASAARADDPSNRSSPLSENDVSLVRSRTSRRKLPGQTTVSVSSDSDDNQSDAAALSTWAAQRRNLSSPDLEASSHLETFSDESDESDEEEEAEEAEEEDELEEEEDEEDASSSEYPDHFHSDQSHEVAEDYSEAQDDGCQASHEYQAAWNDEASFDGYVAR